MGEGGRGQEGWKEPEGEERGNEEEVVREGKGGLVGNGNDII